jgi:hypothetical protein
MSKDLAQSLAESIVRVNKMIWVAGLAAEVSDEFREFVDEDILSREIVEIIPWIETFSPEPDEIVGELILRGLTGFFVCMAAPIATAFLHEGIEYSWGWTRLRWIYVERVEDIADRAKTFREDMNHFAHARLEAKRVRDLSEVVE